jgi:hypothetical protein
MFTRDENDAITSGTGIVDTGAIGVDDNVGQWFSALVHLDLFLGDDVPEVIDDVIVTSRGDNFESAIAIQIHSIQSTRVNAPSP